MPSSRQIDSPQNTIHKNLDIVVKKHIHHPYQKPFQDHNIDAFKVFFTRLKQDRPKELILDSCCGTGLSTRKIALAKPEALVVGIDQSKARLSKQYEEYSTPPQNCLLIRCNCEDFWRLSVQEGILFHKHYILYPNPYPKSEHLKRRWHGHPVFTTLPALSKEIELRSNWKIYIEEFQAAWQILTNQHSDIQNFIPESPITLFEKKYTESGQALYRLQCTPASFDKPSLK